MIENLTHDVKKNPKKSQLRKLKQELIRQPVWMRDRQRMVGQVIQDGCQVASGCGLPDRCWQCLLGIHTLDFRSFSFFFFGCRHLSHVPYNFLHPVSPIGGSVMSEIQGMSPLDTGTRQVLDQGCSKISGGRETILPCGYQPQPQIPSNSYKSITRAKLKITQLYQLIKDRLA